MCARYSIGFIRQDYINIILEFSSVLINLLVTLVALWNSVIARSKLCLSRSVMGHFHGDFKFLTLYTSTLLLDRVSQNIVWSSFLENVKEYSYWSSLCCFLIGLDRQTDNLYAFFNRRITLSFRKGNNKFSFSVY